MQIDELQRLCFEVQDIDVELEKLKDQTSDLNTEKTKLKKEILAHLEKHDLKNFNFGNGKVGISEERSVKMVDKYVFFQWLKERNMFEDIVSVNAQTLKSIYKKEFEKAKEEGDLEFLEKGLPGVSKPSVFNNLKFYKK